MRTGTAGNLLWLVSAILSVHLGAVSPVYSQQPTPVIVSEARVDTFFDRFEALGTLKANESITVTSAVTDTITQINFDDGQRVEAGEILVEMTNSEEHALIAEERSNLLEAEKQLERATLLLKKRAGSETLLDQRRRDFETAKARLLQVESRLQDRLILAPFSGVVGLRNISVGALVEPGDVITTLDDDRVMKLDFAVPATALASVAPGLEIHAQSAAFGERVFKGKIASLDSRVDVVTRSITARALLDNPDRSLRPGMLLSVELLSNSREAVVVMENALIAIGNTAFVYVVNTSTTPASAEKRQVVTGGRRTGEVEIIEGVAPGEMVVVHGAMRLRPDAPVKIVAVDDGTLPIGEMLGNQEGR